VIANDARQPSQAISAVTIGSASAVPARAPES
jgi:hypothetical protein